MKFLKISLSLIFAMLLNACDGAKDPSEETIWVNSHKVDCEGVGPMRCLQIQKGAQVSNGAWKNIYADIEGFDYQPGSIYKLKVRTEITDAKSTPADASTHKYVLVEILSQEVNPLNKLNDIWVLTHINGDLLKLPSEALRPYLEIQIAENKIFGKGACNRFFGTILNINERQISFDQGIGSTKKMCVQESELEDAYLRLLTAVKGYRVENGVLTLLDTNGDAILQFDKTD